MFEMPTGISESEALAKRKASRQPEPENAPTENQDVVDVSEDTPTENIEQPVEQEIAEAESTVLDVEESAEEDETQSEETDLFYYEIDGEEVSSDQLKEWKSNGLMQADYTRKTQELAASRKDLESEREALNSQKAKISEQLATLEVMISEDSLTDEQLQEMREYEPERYIEHIEKQSKRKELLKEAKKNAKPQVNVQEEQAKLIKANPQWLSDGKATEAYTKDMEALTSYYNDNGFTQEQVDAVNSSALLAQAVIDAARFKSMNVKKAVVEKRVRKAPVITKPKATSQPAVTSEIKKLEERVRKFGREEDFVKLRQLKRQER